MANPTSVRLPCRLVNFYLCGVRPLYGLEFWPFVDSVHFVGWSLDPSWYPSTLWTYLSFSTLIGSVHVVDWSWPFVDSVHFVDWSLDPSWDPSTLWTSLSFSTLVGSVHVVDWSLDLLWGPSTLWIYFKFWPLLGPSTLWIGVLTFRGVHPFCGHELLTLVIGSVHIVDCSFDPLWDPSTLWICFRPFCGFV